MATCLGATIATFMAVVMENKWKKKWLQGTVGIMASITAMIASLLLIALFFLGFALLKVIYVYIYV